MKDLIKVTEVFFFLALLMSCTNDDVSENFVSDSKMADDVAISMSYDMVSATYTTPKNAEDVASVTAAEETLATPFFSGCHVETKIFFDGTTESVIEMTSPEENPDYSPNTIGGNMSLPERYQTKKIVIEDGSSTHYNAEDEVISVNEQSTENAAFFESLVADMTENQQFSGEVFDAILESFRQAGYSVVDDTSEPEQAEMELVRSDGGSTILIVDKQRQHVSSRIQLNANGEVESSSDWLFTDVDETKSHPLYHRFLTYYKSPFSDVPMTIRKMSKFENFNLVKNL